ncbi:MAG: glycosyltransferase family 9 protein [Cytophagales bacterium]|nr:glycosyltransferase family 9 protein [Cytophagales bacterium]
MRFDALGDFVLFCDAARHYRTIYKDYHLTLLCHPICAKLAADTGYFNEILTFDRKKFMLNPVYRYKSWKLLLSQSYDTVIYTAFSHEFATGALIIAKVKAYEKIGAYSDYAIDHKIWVNISQKWFTRLHSIKGSDVMHELYKNAALVSQIANIEIIPSLPMLNINEVGDSKMDMPDKYYVIFPGARVGIRAWAAANYAKLSEYIYEHTQLVGVICGSTSEKDISDAIISQSKAKIINMCGKTDVPELMSVIKSAKLLVGNETSGVHIAACAGTPSVCILGGGHFNRFVPYPTDLQGNTISIPTPVYEHMPCYGCNWNCIYQISKSTPVPCISAVSVDKVWHAVQKYL